MLSKKHGFTLVELLTVIAIVGVLAALAVAGLGSVRESARAAQCSSNLRQIFTGMRLFSTDNQNGILRWVDQKPGATPGHDVLWYEALAFGGYVPHYQSSRVWACESNVDGQYSVGETQLVSNLTLRHGMNYAINAVVPGKSHDGRRGPSYPYNEAAIPRVRTRISELSAPNRTIAVTDGKTWLIHDNSGGNKATPAGVHKGGMNAVFWDGHVEYFATVPSISDPLFSVTK